MKRDFNYYLQKQYNEGIGEVFKGNALGYIVDKLVTRIPENATIVCDELLEKYPEITDAMEASGDVNEYNINNLTDVVLDFINNKTDFKGISQPAAFEITKCLLGRVA